MIFSLEGTLEAIARKAKEMSDYEHIVFGVDIYRTKESAMQDKAFLNEKHPYTYSKISGLYLSSRYYGILDRNDATEYQSCTTIEEIRNILMSYRVQGASFLTNNIIHHEDTDGAYVLTSLTDLELKELLRKSPLGN